MSSLKQKKSESLLFQTNKKKNHVMLEMYDNLQLITKYNEKTLVTHNKQLNTYKKSENKEK